MSVRLALCIVLLVAIGVTSAEGMHLYLKGNTQTCVGQDVVRDVSDKSVRIDIYYNIHYQGGKGGARRNADAAGNAAKVRVYLTKADLKPVPETESIIALKTDENDMTSYYATQSGFYFFCFQVDGPKTNSYKAEVEVIPSTTQRTLDGEPATSQVRTKQQRAKGISQDTYIRKINTIDTLVMSSEDEMKSLLGRQKSFDGTVVSTHRRVVWFTLANALIVFGTAGWQMLHLKRFFKNKKLV
eukprot:GILI01014610.1.p1 GENE.GILI01014610.1~~GILI01014610.1.p1  ORF type:complete len:242 (-),score=59.84 GILI01014610.1:85-810(-)